MNVLLTASKLYYTLYLFLFLVTSGYTLIYQIIVQPDHRLELNDLNMLWTVLDP